MAQYQHLPIYKVTYELLQQITKVTKDFPRDFKHSLAVKLRDEVVDLVVFVYKANTFIIVTAGRDADPHQVQATANSYFGLMRHANAWRERQRFTQILRSHGHRVRSDLTRVIV